MALNKWLAAVLIASIFGLTGCAEKKKNNPTATKSPTEMASKAPMETETPDAVASETPDATATAAATPVAGETPKAVAAGGADAAQLEDLENADGMAGYEEVAKMTVVAGSPEKGAEVFKANCTSCHGDTGLGDGPAGGALDPKPRNLTLKDEYKYGHMELAGYRTVFYGVEGTGMAPLGDTLSTQEIWDVVSYVKTLQG